MSIVKVADIEVESSPMRAKAAGNQSIRVLGQTKDEVCLNIIVDKGSAPVNLGACLVVTSTYWTARKGQA